MSGYSFSTMRAGLFAGALAVVAATSSPPAPDLRTADGPVLPRREVLRTVGKSQLPLITDYYWLRSIQQVGRASNANEFRDVYFFTDMTTDLDPKFRYAYEWGSLTVPFNTGRENWVNVDLSNRLLEKALKVFPKDGRFKFQLAYNKMSYQQDYRAAADLLMEASKAPNMPAFLPRLATRLYAQVGAFDAALTTAQLLGETAADESAREFYAKRIREIERERILQHIDAQVARYKDAKGTPPNGIADLVREGLLNKLPEDPLGGEIFLDPDGRARSTSALYRLEMFDAEKKAALRKKLSLPEDAYLNAPEAGQ